MSGKKSKERQQKPHLKRRGEGWTNQEGKGHENAAGRGTHIKSWRSRTHEAPEERGKKGYAWRQKKRWHKPQICGETSRKKKNQKKQLKHKKKWGPEKGRKIRGKP